MSGGGVVSGEMDVHVSPLRRLPTSAVRVVVVVFVVTSVIAALVALNFLARSRLRGHEGQTIAFSEIECSPPTAIDCGRFLGEVQYLNELPDRVDLLDQDLPSRLAAAFARHPWVGEVNRVEVVPPRRIALRLTFRQPVLAVAVSAEDGKRLGGLCSIEMPAAKSGALTTPGRTVDRHGVLLPVETTVKGLPLLRSAVPAPAGPPGTSWGDAAVEAAARIADLLQPHQDRLNLWYIDAAVDGLTLTTPAGSRVLWGHAAGAEKAEEALAEVKVQRLLDFCQRHGSLEVQSQLYEHDVRPKAEAVHRPLSRGD